MTINLTAVVITSIICLSIVIIALFGGKKA